MNDVKYSKGTWHVGLATQAVNVDVVWASLGKGDEVGRGGVRERMETDLQKERSAYRLAAGEAL